MTKQHEPVLICKRVTQRSHERSQSSPLILTINFTAKRLHNYRLSQV
ncbi:MAG: hypothetical protein RM368_02780 [Nostoc sp. DedSLP03]|nr:hypothetical protein [Nostoc sp. DedSLP03]MDZ7963888.1 hypothetical protein [Nostoc sp. DedSLP03]